MVRWVISIVFGALAGLAEYFLLIHTPIVAVLVGLNFMLTFALARVKVPFWTKRCGTSTSLESYRDHLCQALITCV
ncbi:hypothetical protein [Alicyclobacillus tolerans]|uniref:Uncharacterized protein n=1 Tax=Alicyclobacillus tolerans TaxID=90970 RepID=A0A1M6TLP6_9BACL|nr:hypothetical protein [Alicyclobacillus montanus]SHK57840.1 hypothetical protein SAMN05443507_11710 [Alicyclobacillus montanus]